MTTLVPKPTHSHVVVRHCVLALCVHHKRVVQTRVADVVHCSQNTTKAKSSQHHRSGVATAAKLLRSWKITDAGDLQGKEVQHGNRFDRSTRQKQAIGIQQHVGRVEVVMVRQLQR